MIDKIGLNGHLRIEKKSLDGSFEYRDIPNTILTIGKSQTAGLLVEDVNVGSAFSHVSFGLGSSTITAGDTILGSEAFKHDTSGLRVTTTVTNDTAQFSGAIVSDIDANKVINEAGIFNASGLNTGSILARTTFTGITIGSRDQISYTWNVAVS